MPLVDQIRVIDFTNGEPTIGMGFNSDTLLFPGTGLNFTRVPPDPSESGQVVAAHAEIVSSHEELMQKIGVSINVSGRYALSTASAKVDYSKETGFNTTSTFVLATASVINPIVRGANFTVTPPADELLRRHDVDSFKRAFGDSFVRGIKTGGEFFAVFRLTSLRTTTQEKLAATLTTDINFALAEGHFKGQFETARNDESERAELQISFYQTSGSGPTASITLNPDEMLQRLKNFPTVALQNPKPFKVEIATYDTIPIPIPTAEEHDDFLLSLSHDDAKKLEYIQRRNDLDFAILHPEYFDELPPITQLQSESEIYLQLTNAVMAHAVKLAKGQFPTPEMFDPAMVGLTEPPPRVFKRKVPDPFVATLTRIRESDPVAAPFFAVPNGAGLEHPFFGPDGGKFVVFDSNLRFESPGVTTFGPTAAIFNHPTLGTHYVYGDIFTRYEFRYRLCFGNAGFNMGYPKGEVSPLVDETTLGRVQRFENGSISPEFGEFDNAGEFVNNIDPSQGFAWHGHP